MGFQFENLVTLNVQVEIENGDARDNFHNQPCNECILMPRTSRIRTHVTRTIQTYANQNAQANGKNECQEDSESMPELTRLTHAHVNVQVSPSIIKGDARVQMHRLLDDYIFLAATQAGGLLFLEPDIIFDRLDVSVNNLFALYRASDLLKFFEKFQATLPFIGRVAVLNLIAIARRHDLREQSGSDAMPVFQHGLCDASNLRRILKKIIGAFQPKLRLALTFSS